MPQQEVVVVGQAAPVTVPAVTVARPCYIMPLEVVVVRLAAPVTVPAVTVARPLGMLTINQ